MSKIYKDKGTESISRNLIFDNELSDRARFVYCFMMAKPDKWDFLIAPMAKELGYSPDTLHKYINELIKRGWLTKVEQSRDEKERFGAVDYIIHENRKGLNGEPLDNRKDKKPSPKKAVTEKSRDGKKPPQKDNIDYKEIQDLKEIEEKNITSTIVDVPQSGGEGKEGEILEAEVIEEAPRKRKTEKKAEDKKEKKYTVTHRCRLIFEKEYLQKKGIEYYYAAKDAMAVKQIVGKIRQYLPENEKGNEDAIVENFYAFVHLICTSGRVGQWILDNLSLPNINSKFNELYSQLKNGNQQRQQHQNARDDEQAFLDALERRYGSGQP